VTPSGGPIRGVLHFNVGFQPETCGSSLARSVMRGLSTDGSVRRGLSRDGGPCAKRVRVLEYDPELGLRIPVDGITRARTELVAPLQAFGRGIWEIPSDDRPAARLGYLVLEGLLGRDVILAGRTCTELLGEGDVLLPPSAYVREEKLVRYHVQWHVLEPVRLAVLDDAFARALTEWPQVISALFERGMRRSLRMSVHQALLQLSPVESRLLVLFWFLAERWGRVTPAGIVVSLRLSHQLLGQLVGCQRASVTTALHRVSASGLLERRPDGTWLLHGPPPDELAHLHWQPRELVAAGANA
jgi:CRP/FNR family transcriptional regulator, cyclic AMP receptor protein